MSTYLGERDVDSLHPTFRDLISQVTSPERRAAFNAARVGEEDWEVEREWGNLVDEVWRLVDSRALPWLRRLPVRLRDATLDALTDEQHPDVIRKWLGDTSARTLFLVGPPGVGKTWAAYALAIGAVPELLTAREPLPEVWTVPGLLDSLRPGADNPENTWRAVKSTPLLILDDLAHTRPTDWAQERMWMLADSRNAADLRTVLTTNATWPDLEATWGVPTMDRFNDASAVVKFAGESRRRPAW